MAPDASTTAPVSAVIPCRNAAGTLEACLTALAAGRVRPAQTIVVDDGSSDGSAALAAAHGAEVLRRPHGEGAAAARNHGLAAAEHRLVMLLDADVAVAPDALARALTVWHGVAAAAGAAGVQGVYARRFGGQTTAGAFKHARQWRNIAALAPGPVPLLGSSLALVDREAVAAGGGFDAGLPGAGVEDRLLGARMAAAGRSMWLDPAVVGTHLHDYGVWSLLRGEARRARDEVAYGGNLGPARAYVSAAARLRYGMAAAAVAALGAAVVAVGLGAIGPEAAWRAALAASAGPLAGAGAVLLGVAAVWDLAAVAGVRRGLEPGWLLLSPATLVAAVLGAVVGAGRRVAR